MAKYTVYMPFTGYGIVTVEAESEEDALQAFWHSEKDPVIEELEYTRRVTRGNVTHAVLDAAYAELVEG